MKKNVLVGFLVWAATCSAAYAQHPDARAGQIASVGRDRHGVDSLLTAISSSTSANIRQSARVLDAYSAVLQQNPTLSTQQTTQLTAILQQQYPGASLAYNAQTRDLILSDAQAAAQLVIPAAYIDCRATAPKDIRGLLDGVSLDAYEYKKGDEIKLAALGFLDVTFGRDERITVVEFAQTGSQDCNGQRLKYGVGARMMMRIRSKKGNAKLNTPQQISASVTFGRAEVTYSMKTFGITGPGTAGLVKNGTLGEDTYVEFIKSISDLIVSMYSPNSPYTITPQPLVAGLQ